MWEGGASLSFPVSITWLQMVSMAKPREGVGAPEQASTFKTSVFFILSTGVKQRKHNKSDLLFLAVRSAWALGHVSSPGLPEYILTVKMYNSLLGEWSWDG